MIQKEEVSYNILDGFDSSDQWLLMAYNNVETKW